MKYCFILKNTEGKFVSGFVIEWEHDNDREDFSHCFEEKKVEYGWEEINDYYTALEIFDDINYIFFKDSIKLLPNIKYNEEVSFILGRNLFRVKTQTDKNYVFFDEEYLNKIGDYIEI